MTLNWFIRSSQNPSNIGKASIVGLFYAFHPHRTEFQMIDRKEEGTQINLFLLELTPS
jgi:hypothetical protein